MVLAEFGPGTDLAKRLRKLEDAVQALSTRDVLQNSSIGINGMTVDGGQILVTNGGSIEVDGSGTISLPTGAFSAGSVTTNALTVNGNETVTGTSNSGAVSTVNVTATGSVAGGTGIFNGGLFSTAVYSTVISGTRTATWTQNDGTMGTSPSSIRFKTNVQPIAWDDTRMQSILSANAKYYQYKAEIARRDDLTSPNYVGPDYHVHTELGYIAEELHAAGLWEVVIYERTEDGSPKLDANGSVIPFGVHYELLGIYALEAAAWLWGKVQAQQADIAAIKTRLGM